MLGYTLRMQQVPLQTISDTAINICSHIYLQVISSLKKHCVLKTKLVYHTKNCTGESHARTQKIA